MGLPAVVIIILCLKEDKKILLIDSINTVYKAETMEKIIRYYLDLVDKKDTDRQSTIILDGYIYLYNEFDKSPTSPLQQYVLEKDSDTNQGNSSTALLYQHAKKLYNIALSKHTENVFLRMSYAIFLRERLKNKKQCFIELATAESNKPRFDQEFLIYRYRKMVEETPDHTESLDEESTLDVVAGMAYNNYYSQCNFY